MSRQTKILILAPAIGILLIVLGFLPSIFPNLPQQICNHNVSLSYLYDTLGESVIMVRNGEGGGSGFIVDKDKGLILTAYHVIRQVRNPFADPNEPNQPVDIKVIPYEGCSLDVTIVDVNSSFDLALIRVNSKGIEKLRSIVQYDSSLKPGSSIFTIANPYLFPRSISQGIICGQGYKIPDMWYDTPLTFIDCAGAPGVSGSPVFSIEGNLVGIYVGVFAQYGIMIPVNVIKTFLDKNNVNIY